MSKQTIVRLIDDLDESEATETIMFGLDGVQYEIDLSEVNAGKLRDALAAYVMAGRKAGKTVPAGSNGHKVTSRRGGQPRRSSKRSPEGKAMREWGRARGYRVGDKGVIPAEIRDGYRAAMSGRPVPAPAAAPVANEPDEYDRMKRPELVKIAVARGASSISRAKRETIIAWLREHPEGTAQAQGTARAGREMAARRASKAAEKPAKAPAAPDRSKLTAGQKADLNMQVRRFAKLYGLRLSDRGKIPEVFYAAFHHDDPSLLPAKG